MFFEVALQYTECEDCLGKISNVMSVIEEQRNGLPSAFRNEGRIYRWYNLTYYPIRIKVVQRTNNAQNNSTIIGYVNQWISDMNILLGGNYFIRDDSVNPTEDEVITVHIGTHQQLFGYSPENISGGETMVYYGQWQT